MSAIPKFRRCKTDLSLRDDDVLAFKADLLDIEKEILALLMVNEWLEPQINSELYVSQFYGGKEEKFYATQGPEIHIRRNGDEITVLCSPVSRISFFSNAVWAPERGHRGTGLTKAVCHVQPWEKFIRAEVTDEQGRKAWSKVIRL